MKKRNQVCSCCGRKDREGPDGGRRVGFIKEWNDTLCLPCAARYALLLIKQRAKEGK